MDTKYNLDLKEGIDFFVKKDHWIPKKMGVDYFAFGKTLYYRNSENRIPKHEFFHIVQFHRFGTLSVLFHYCYHLFKNSIKYKNFSKAFAQVPFEIEAREYEARQLNNS